MPLVARNSLVGRAHHILGGRWQRNWCRAALCASCCFLHGKTYHTAILQVLEQQSNVNLELKYVCGCVSTRNLGGPVDIQHAVSEWNEYKPSIYARDSIYAIWKLFICIFVNACAHKTYSEQFSVRISLGKSTGRKWRSAALLHENRGETVHRPDWFWIWIARMKFFWVLPCIVLAGSHIYTFLLCSSPLRGPVGCLKQTDWKLLMGIQTMLIWHILPWHTYIFMKNFKNLFQHWESNINSTDWKSSYF